jgi:hypothetical protein
MHAPAAGTTGKAPPSPVGPLGFGGGVGVSLDTAADGLAVAVAAPPDDTTPATSPNPTAKASTTTPRDAIAFPDR